MINKKHSAIISLDSSLSTDEEGNELLISPKATFLERQRRALIT